MALQFLDEAHKRRTLLSKGFDPEQYDVDVNTGNIIPAVKQQPPTATPTPDLTATQPAPIVNQPMSPLKSAAIGAGTSVLPAAGGLGAAIAAQPVIAPIALATGPAAPFTELGLSLGVAMGGGAAVNWLQNKLMPESMQQTVAEAQQSNPLSFMGGSIAGQLPTMAANPRGVLEAGKTGLKVANNLIKPSVAPLAISAAEKANLANVGIGVGIPAGELMLDAATGKPIDPAMAAMSLAGGAVLNKPSSLANKIFKLNPSAGEVKPSVSPEQLQALEKSVGPNTTTLKDYGPILESQTAQREISRGVIPPGYNVEINATGKNIPPAKAIEDNILSPEIRTKLKPKGDLPERFKQVLPKEGTFNELGIKQDVVIPNKSAAESAETMFDRSLPSVRARDRLETGGDQPQGETTFKTGPESVGLPKAKPVEQIKSERDSNYKLFSDLMAQGKAAEAAKFSSQLGETYYFNRRYSTEKSTGTKAEFPPTEEGKLTAQDKQLLADRRKNFQGITEGENPAALTAETRLKKSAEEAGNQQKLKATKEFFDTFNKIFGPLRNVKQSLDGRLVNRETGKPVRGEIEATRDGLTSLMSKINPNLATPDTVPHEFIHGWFTDFKNSPNRYERMAANNLERAVEQLPEYKADNQRRIDNGKSVLSPEEYIAETGGYEVFNRAVNLDGNQGTFKQGWKDFLSQVKLKIGKASTEDIQQYVTNRFIKDPSFGETFANKYANVQQADEGEDTTQVNSQNQTDNQKPESKINEQGNEQRSEATADKGQRISEENRQGETTVVKAGEPKEAVVEEPKSGAVKNQPSDEGTKSDYQHRDTFELSLQKELRGTNPFGLTPDKDGKLAGNYVADKLPKVLPKLEHDILKEAGIEKFLRYGKHTSAEIEAWVKEHGPKVKVESYGMEGKVSEAKREYDRMTHEWLDVLPQNKLQEYYKVEMNDTAIALRELKQKGWEQKDLDNLSKYRNLKHQVSTERIDSVYDSGPRATSAYDTVSAFPTKEPMPDWTTSKSSKNVQRVDVVIPLKQQEVMSGKRRGTIEEEAEGLRSELWQPDNLHENLPNTLGWAMIQYKDGPKGEKVAVVVEAQSRWGQEVREAKKRNENLGIEPRGANESEYDYRQRVNDANKDQKRLSADHPLLHDYNRLILKAAIDQARKEGATHIVVSDAESAMMTEGHDLNSKINLNEGKHFVPSLKEKSYKYYPSDGGTGMSSGLGRNITLTGNVEVFNKSNLVGGRQTVMLETTSVQPAHKWIYSSDLHLSSNEDVAIKNAIPHTRDVEQEPGMRLNYDTILPKIMEELSGEKGEKVSLGEHKNAMTDNARLSDDTRPRYTPRDNLIFRNPDGTPKTDVSGLMFHLDSVAGKLKDESFSLTGRRYQESSDTDDTSTTEIPRPAPQGKTAKDIRANIEDTLSLPAFKKSGIIKQNLKDLKSRLPIFGSDIDKLSTRAGESGKYIAPAIKEALTKMDELEGRYYNPSIENIKSMKLDDQKLLVDTLREEHRTNTNLRESLPTEQLKEAYDIQRELLKKKQEDQIAAKQPVVEFIKGPRGGYEAVPRDAKVNPFYFPDIAGSKQLDIILNNEGSEAFDILKTDFINHIQDKYSFDRDTALELFEDYKGSFAGGPSGGGNATKFGAVRRAEGIGLPDSWLEADPAVTLRRYWRRVAKDRAWFDAVESDSNNLYILGYSKDSWGNKITPTNDRIGRIPQNEVLSSIIDTVQGVNIKQNPKIDAIARIANNLILGPLTGVNDIISALPVVSKFIPSFGDAPKVYLEAITNITKGIKDAKSTGRIKEKISNLEDIYFPTTETVERLRQMGDGIAKISGREKLEEFSRGLAQAAGESIIKIHRGKAEDGDAKSIKFLEELGNKSDWKSMDDIQLASRIVDLSQGTYDVRGLPSWMINSQVAPFFRMMKWNVEQLNNLHKHVIIPATNGNYTPLLMSLTSGLVGGYIAKEVREKISNKKLNVPTLTELKNSEGSTGDKIHGAAYAAAAAISYSGVMGFLGEILKTIGDVSYKNKPQGFNFPAIEVVTDVVDNISDAAQAIVQEGEDPFKVLPELTKNLLSNNIQAGRLIVNWASDQKTNETSKQKRDLRVYKQLSGKNYSAQTLPQNVNPYVGMDAKKFQKIDNIKELIPEAKRLVKETITKNKGNAEGMKAGLQKLKSGAVTTFPSIDNAPDEFAKYYKYLVKVYGPEEAKRRLKSYNKQRGVNQFRRSLIPSLD